ncbi:hypothetical protein D3C71_1968460 [compost metagenome]
MGSTVNFNDEFGPVAGEVDKIGANRHLTSEMVSLRAQLSQRGPEPGFRRTHRLSQLPSARDAHTPTLIPSP